MSTAFRVGVLLVMALLFLCIGVFLIGNKEFLFSRTYRLKAEFQNVAGLNSGAEVRIGGIHQGTVKEIDLPSQPDAKVTVGGRTIKLRPDGSFSFRFALPDGKYELPVVAVSADQTDGRAAELEFSRRTEYRGEVGVHPQDPRLRSLQVGVGD